MLYICGAGKTGKVFGDIIGKYVKCKDMLAFWDNTKEMAGTEIGGVPVLDYSMMKEKENTGLNESMFVIAAEDTDKQDFVEQLKEMHADKYIYDINQIERCLDDMEQFIGKPVLPYIETHMSDHCNLNCKGCGHLSNVAPEKFADYEKFSSDIHRLKKLFGDIEKIRLMGGEPFLNPQLIKFVELVKKEYSSADIRIVTNGLFLGLEKEKTLKRLADLDVWLDISGYPPTIKREKEIRNVLDQYRIQYRFTEKIEKFFRFRNPNENIEIEEAFEHCPIKMCTFLREGKMAPCSFPILYSELDTFMKGKFRIDGGDIIDIYSENINGWTIAWKLAHPIYACKYCRTNELEFYPWEQALKAEASCNDWFVEE